MHRKLSLVLTMLKQVDFLKTVDEAKPIEWKLKDLIGRVDINLKKHLLGITCRYLALALRNMKGVQLHILYALHFLSVCTHTYTRLRAGRGRLQSILRLSF